MFRMSGLDSALEKVVRELQSRYGVLIQVMCDDESIYMVVCSNDPENLRMSEEIRLSGREESKFVSMSAMRRWFRNGEWDKVVNVAEEV